MLINRLRTCDLEWPEYQALMDHVAKTTWQLVKDENLGNYYVSKDERLCFAAPAQPFTWPDWRPTYVRTLFGMKAGHYEMAGGYADRFDGQQSDPLMVFTGGVEDELFGYPPIEISCNLYPFQSNINGALFHVSREGNVMDPDASTGALSVLDSVEQFSRNAIVQALKGNDWFCAYRHLNLVILD
ncbi:MAG: hypothetical protein KDC35_08655 [Acidobacteria bacterium]|nr:hypothetical protein [Acidobacteriota bacterium]